MVMAATKEKLFEFSFTFFLVIESQFLINANFCVLQKKNVSFFPYTHHHHMTRFPFSSLVVYNKRSRSSLSASLM